MAKQPVKPPEPSEPSAPQPPPDVPPPTPPVPPPKPGGPLPLNEGGIVDPRKLSPGPASGYEPGGDLS